MKSKGPALSQKGAKGGATNPTPKKEPLDQNIEKGSKSDWDTQKRRDTSGPMK